MPLFGQDDSQLLPRAWRALALLGLLPLGGCCGIDLGGTPSCTSTSGSLGGYVVFTSGTPIVAGSSIMIDWSTDNFASVDFPGASIANAQGFVAVPFRMPISFCGSITVQLKAFQDTNGNGTWDNGEATGRADGSSNGNGTYQALTLNTSSPTLDGVIIYLDGTAQP